MEKKLIYKMVNLMVNLVLHKNYLSNFKNGSRIRLTVQFYIRIE